jgi:hypothetical protein
MPNAIPQKGDRWIIFAQIAFGAALVMLGGFLAAFTSGAETVATAIIAVGAAMIPPGAASAASVRILRTLPDPDVTVAPAPAVAAHPAAPVQPAPPAPPVPAPPVQPPG